jgi:hypothetical protein
MALAGDKYYIQGFAIDASTKTSIQIVESLFENSISTGSKVIITYKAGAKASDFISILPSGITIEEGDRLLTSFRVQKLEPKVLNLNSTEVEVYDLENRVLNYLIVQDRQSSLLEVRRHTAMVILHTEVNDEVKMRSIIDSSKYFKFRSIPLNETYSFTMVNTHSSNLNILSETDRPISLSKFTPYRMEYSKVLIGFYDQLKLQLPEFQIYLGEDRLKDSNIIDSHRISINLESLDNLNRRPYMGDLDIIDSIATLNITVETNDQLKYNYIKNAYQNLNLISNLARYTVKDIHGYDWMTHVEWSPTRDEIRMSEIRDDMGRFAYVLKLRCDLHFYVVKDQLYNMILAINTNYEVVNNGRGLNLLIT